MDFNNLSFMEKEKAKKYVIIGIIVIFLLLITVGYFIGKSILKNSYDSKQQFIEVLSEDKGVGVNKGEFIFSNDNIPELPYTSNDVLNMDSEERYNADLISLSTKNIWDSLGEKLKLEGCSYEVGNSEHDILYKISKTSIGDIYIRCGSVVGDIKQIYKDGSFSEEDKKILDSIDSYNLYYQDKDCEVVIIGGKKGMIKSEENN